MGITKIINLVTKSVLVINLFCSVNTGAQSKQVPTVINGGNNQFGNNNTQNFYSDYRLKKSDIPFIEKRIFKIEHDSDFYYIRHFCINKYEASNGAAFMGDLIQYFTEETKWTNAHSGAGLFFSDPMVYGVQFDISKQDSCLMVWIGMLPTSSPQWTK